VDRESNSRPWVGSEEKCVYENLAEQTRRRQPSTWVPSDFFRVGGRVELGEVGKCVKTKRQEASSRSLVRRKEDQSSQSKSRAPKPSRE
jgi:hypothetical protein